MLYCIFYEGLGQETEYLLIYEFMRQVNGIIQSVIKSDLFNEEVFFNDLKLILQGDINLCIVFQCVPEEFRKLCLPGSVNVPYADFIANDPDIYLKGYEKNKEALSNTKVEEIMHTWVKKAKKDTLESEIAAIMGDNKVNRVPIVDVENKVIGIIARSDLIKSMIKKGI